MPIAPSLEHESSADRVEMAAALLREPARCEAQAAAVMADAYDEVLDGPNGSDESVYNSLFSEFAFELHITDGAAASLMMLGHELKHRFPRTRQAFAVGELSLTHARHIVHEAEAIRENPEAIAAYEAEIVAYATTTTASRTRARAKQLVAAIEGINAVDRHRQARKRRHVRVTEGHDGMGELIIHGPMVLVRGAYDRITEQAKGLAVQSDAEDDRCRDEIRADIAFDYLLGASAEQLASTGLNAIRAHINVTLSAKFLAGSEDRAAELDGFGPMCPEIARELAGINPIWTKLFLDHNGQTVSTSSYSPTAEMRRTIQARDKHCQAPGCRAPATRCEIDHNHDWAKGGKTQLNNLRCFCTRHHPLKHPQVADEHRWKVTRPEPGLIKWESPSGRTYTNSPEPRVMFIESPDGEEVAVAPPEPIDPRTQNRAERFRGFGINDSWPTAA